MISDVWITAGSGVVGIIIGAVANHLLANRRSNRETRYGKRLAIHNKTVSGLEDFEAGLAAIERAEILSPPAESQYEEAVAALGGAFRTLSGQRGLWPLYFRKDTSELLTTMLNRARPLASFYAQTALSEVKSSRNSRTASDIRKMKEGFMSAMGEASLKLSFEDNHRIVWPRLRHWQQRIHSRCNGREIAKWSRQGYLGNPFQWETQAYQFSIEVPFEALTEVSALVAMTGNKATGLGPGESDDYTHLLINVASAMVRTPKVLRRPWTRSVRDSLRCSPSTALAASKATCSPL